VPLALAMRHPAVLRSRKSNELMSSYCTALTESDYRSHQRVLLPANHVGLKLTCVHRRNSAARDGTAGEATERYATKGESPAVAHVPRSKGCTRALCSAVHTDRPANRRNDPNTERTLAERDGVPSESSPFVLVRNLRYRRSDGSASVVQQTSAFLFEARWHVPCCED